MKTNLLIRPVQVSGVFTSRVYSNQPKDYGMVKKFHPRKQWNVSTLPYYNANGGIIKTLMKILLGWVITSHRKWKWAWLRIHVLIVVHLYFDKEVKHRVGSMSTINMDTEHPTQWANECFQRIADVYWNVKAQNIFVTNHVSGELWEDLERKRPPYGHPLPGIIR